MKIVTLVAALVVLTLPGQDVADPSRIPFRIAAIAAGVTFAVLFSTWAALSTIRRITPRPSDRIVAANRYHRLYTISKFIDLGVFLVAALPLGWVSIVRQTSWARIPLFEELVILLPLLLMAWMACMGMVRVERAFERTSTRPNPSRLAPRDHLFRVWTLFRIEHGYWLLVTSVVVGTQACLDLFAPSWERHPTAALAVLSFLASLLLVLYPLAIRYFWPVKPLPAGPHRDALLDWSRKLRVRYRDILVWHTRHGQANAAITGLWAPLRYVLFTDTILDHLTMPELLAVFGHEAGHIRHRHMMIQLGMVLASLAAMVALDAAWPVVMAGEINNEYLRALLDVIPPALLLGIPLVGGMVGYLSRRFERQADLAAVDAVSELLPPPAPPADTHAATNGVTSPRHHATLVFAHALHKVARLNGADIDKWSWRYGRLRQRMRFLERVGPSSQASRRYHQRTRWIVASMIGFLALGGASAALSRWLS